MKARENWSTGNRLIVVKDESLPNGNLVMTPEEAEEMVEELSRIMRTE